MLVVEEKGCPRIGEVYALDVRDLMRINITPSVCGENINRVSKKNLEENGKRYGEQYREIMVDFNHVEKIEDLESNDTGRSYCLSPSKISNNNENLITFVKYLGNGIFLDLITDKMIRAYISDPHDENGKLYEADQDADSLYVDEFIYSATNSRDITEDKAFYMATPLVFNVSDGVLLNNPDEKEKARLYTIDDEIIRRFSKQDPKYLRKYLKDLHKDSVENLKRQIDLLFLQDEYLAYAENDFRNSLGR